MDKLKVEVVVTTYNNPVFLSHVLAALSKQKTEDFAICIADDGSSRDTAELLDQWKESFFHGRLRHIWQPDDGFQKNRILNKSISTSSADYLIFIDGDCLASPDFINRHLELAKRGFFISGGLVRMPEEVNSQLKTEMILDGSIFKAEWLRSHVQLKTVSQRLKAGLIPFWVANALEIISPVKRTWNGCNASGWRSDLLEVNGFNESMHYGAEDVELGVRLNNMGIDSRHCRYTAPLLHMEHGRSYAHTEEIAANKLHVRRLRKCSTFWTPHGIQSKVDL